MLKSVRLTIKLYHKCFWSFDLLQLLTFYMHLGSSAKNPGAATLVVAASVVDVKKCFTIPFVFPWPDQ